MNKEEVLRLIEETTAEVLNKNPEALSDQFQSTIEIAVKLSCLVNLRMLEKLEIIGEIK